jgi:Na+-transporting NADH:ubiquinone oxidoreductase subunit NqrC
MAMSFWVKQHTKHKETKTMSDSITYVLVIVLMLCILAMPLIALAAIFYPEIRAALLA